MTNYYISEMNISAKHGGGLTLMRVLGNDLAGFKYFISPIQYPLKGFEAIEDVTSRELNLWENPGDFQPRPMPRRFSTDYLLSMAKRILNIPNPRYINWDYYRKFYTTYLEKTIDLKNGRFLTVPQNAHSVIISNHLFKRFQIPYATWMMDDNLLRFNSSTKTFEYLYPKGYEVEFGYHLQNAKHVFVISDNMGQFYKDKYGIDYSVLFSPANPTHEATPVKQQHNHQMRFCYFGRLWKWPLDAAERFAANLELLDATMDIYSHLPLEGVLKDNKRVRIQPTVDGPDVIKKMAEYDAVTIFYGFNDDVRHWSELNISTKMSECLASGIPSIFVGPGYGAMSKWVRKQDCGLLITEPENEGQVQQIIKLRDFKFRSQIIKKSLEASEKYTSVDAMRKVWRHGWSKVV